MPTTLVWTNSAGPSMERSTWDSAAKLTMRRGPVLGEEARRQRSIADVAVHEDVSRIVRSDARFSRLPA